MKPYHFLLYLVLFLTVTLPLYAQTTPAQKARVISMDGLEQMEKGNYDAALEIFEKSRQMDTATVRYPYHMACIYILKGEHKKAVELLENMLHKKDIGPRVYFTLSKEYDTLGLSEKALQISKSALWRFPEYGAVYTWYGFRLYDKGEFLTAGNVFLSGILAEPAYTDNYYGACKTLCLHSDEKLSGLLLGEAFLNLDTSVSLTSEISSVLYSVYKKQIKFTSDSSYTVTFSKHTDSITILKGKNAGKMLPALGTAIYEPLLSRSLKGLDSISLASLNTIRSRFIEKFYQQKLQKDYPHPIFTYHHKLMKAGYMEPYNYWLLRAGNEEEFRSWYKYNKKLYEEFVVWYQRNSYQAHITVFVPEPFSWKIE